jgi:hypothetical protein
MHIPELAEKAVSHYHALVTFRSMVRTILPLGRSGLWAVLLDAPTGITEDDIGKMHI